MRMTCKTKCESVDEPILLADKEIWTTLNC